MYPDAPDESERLTLAIEESKRLIAQSERILRAQIAPFLLKMGYLPNRFDGVRDMPTDRDQDASESDAVGR